MLYAAYRCLLWSLEGGEAVLLLVRVGSLHASGELDEYMSFHIGQERQRETTARS